MPWRVLGRCGGSSGLTACPILRRHDMCACNHPMDRLICGDVGFGKTEVAMRALFRCFSNGRQAVLLAPTTVLAAQHYRSPAPPPPVHALLRACRLRVVCGREVARDVALVCPGEVDALSYLVSRFSLASRTSPLPPHRPFATTSRSSVARFEGFGARICHISRHLSAKDKKEAIAAINAGVVDIVVGTHAALSSRMKYPNLGTIVVDEEQRFGVNQKEKLKSLRTGVDVLTLTATPIPRTLQMALTGLREMSVIQTPPPSRKPVVTEVQAATDKVLAKAIGRELARGGQVYCVAPRIAELDSIAGRIGRIFPESTVMLAHGEHADVENRLLRFAEGEAQVLVCTSIIESGLDISNVNTIVIFSSHMFGLSSLYQLRGRVGRGRVQAHAVLTFDPGFELSDDGKNRLESMLEFSQLGAGFQLAQRDLEIRGAGSMLGADQSGEVNSVGFELYTELLHQAIIEIRSAKARGGNDADIEDVAATHAKNEDGPGE